MPTPPETPSSRATLPTAAHPAEVLRVLDGDTFEARINLWPGLEVTTRVRLRGIDAPEMKARCGEERFKAEAARDALRNLLDQGDVGISQVTLDKYGGRVLAPPPRGRRRMFPRRCSTPERCGPIPAGGARAGARKSHRVTTTSVPTRTRP
jgi:endonuclease YncB( thermonuclease family)